MSFSRPIQWYHYHADPIWSDGIFKVFPFNLFAFFFQFSLIYSHSGTFDAISRFFAKVTRFVCIKNVKSSQIYATG